MRAGECFLAHQSHTLLSCVSGQRIKLHHYRGVQTASMPHLNIANIAGMVLNAKLFRSVSHKHLNFPHVPPFFVYRCNRGRETNAGVLCMLQRSTTMSSSSYLPMVRANHVKARKWSLVHPFAVAALARASLVPSGTPYPSNFYRDTLPT